MYNTCLKPCIESRLDHLLTVERVSIRLQHDTYREMQQVQGDGVRSDRSKFFPLETIQVNCMGFTYERFCKILSN